MAIEIKIIKNEMEYNAALKQLSEILDKDYTPGSKEENAMELLLLVIQDYERKNEQPLELDSLAAIKFRMEQMQLSKKDLVPFFGSESKVSEVFSGRRRLSLSMIQKLHEGLGIPLKSLIAQRPSSSTKRRKLSKRKVKKHPAALKRSRKKSSPNRKARI